MRSVCIILLSLFVFQGVVEGQDCDSCAATNNLQSAFLDDSVARIGAQLSYDYRHTMLTGSSDTANAADEKVATTLVNLFYSHTLLEDVTLDLYLPFLSRAYTERPNYTYDSGRESGIGDITLVSTFQIFQGKKDRKMVDWRLRAGVKLPTADGSMLNDYPRDFTAPVAGAPVYPTSAVYPYDRALGSGSVDWIVGSSYVAQYEEIIGLIDAQFIGRTEGDNNFTFGDTVTARVAPGYIFSRAAGNEFSALLEAAYRYDGSADYDGFSVPDSGQSAFLLGPKLMLKLKERFIGSFGVSLPLYQSVEGTQLASDYQILASMMYGF